MNIIVMDTRRHKTISRDCAGHYLLQAVDFGSGPLAYAQFEMAGFLYGDPVFYQTKGPELPATWWERLN